MRKEKILIDGRLLTDRPTGISRYCSEVIKSYIHEYGSDAVFVLCNKDSEHLYSNSVVTSFKPFNLFHFILFSIWLCRSDFTTYHSTTYSGILFKKRSLRYIVTVHDVFYRIVPDFFSEHSIVNFLAIQYYNILVSFSLNAASVIVSVSNTTNIDVERFFKRKSIIIPEGANKLHTKEVEKKQKGDFFLYAGNLRKQKNIQFLMDVFAMLPDERLIICGNNIGLDKLWKTMSNVSFIGFVSDEELMELYSSCKAFIFPSLYEGFGLPVLEALSYRALVFSSTGGALKEFKNSNIYHFDPNSKAELIALILNVDNFIFNTDHADVILEEYSWDRVLEKMHREISAF